MKTANFTSPLAKRFDEFLNVKRALGYKYENGENLLMRFDKICAKFPGESGSLSKEAVLEWISKRPNETAATQQKRIDLAEEFALFMAKCGDKAYILPPQKSNYHESYVPHIFTPTRKSDYSLTP